MTSSLCWRVIFCYYVIDKKYLLILLMINLRVEKFDSLFLLSNYFFPNFNHIFLSTKLVINIIFNKKIFLKLVVNYVENFREKKK